MELRKGFDLYVSMIGQRIHIELTLMGVLLGNILVIQRIPTQKQVPANTPAR